MGDTDKARFYRLGDQQNMGTPVRKSDQWHRLAAVVRSSQKTFLTCSPKVDTLPRAKTLGNIPKGVNLPTEGKTTFQRSLSPNFSLNPKLENSPSKIRSLSKYYESQREGLRDDGHSSKRFKTDFSKSYVDRKANRERQKTHDGCYNNNRAESSKSSRFSKVSLKSMSDPYSQKYLCSFMIVSIIVAAVTMVLSNNVAWNFSWPRPVNRRLTESEISVLENNLRERVFGQHIARKVVVDMIRTVTAEQETKQPCHHGVKMTVLSFHGWTGVGKTFLTQLIADSLNPEKFIRFIIPVHFPHALEDDTNQAVIQHSVISNISRSAVSVVIFDEMDKASPGVLQGIATSLLHIKVDDSYSNATIIVLFVSNSLGQKLNSHLFRLLSEGKMREDLKASDFDEVFQLSLLAPRDYENSHNYGGRFWYDVFTQHGLIDTFVPFLPLNLVHVQQCVHHRLQFMGIEPTTNLVDGITRELSLFQPTGLSMHYSQTGCKRVSEKVDLHSE